MKMASEHCNFVVERKERHNLFRFFEAVDRIADAKAIQRSYLVAKFQSVWSISIAPLIQPVVRFHLTQELRFSLERANIVQDDNKCLQRQWSILCFEWNILSAIRIPLSRAKIRRRSLID